MFSSVRERGAAARSLTAKGRLDREPQPRPVGPFPFRRALQGFYDDQSNTATAQTACQAEQADANFAASHGGKTFDQYYGVGKQNKDAFGKCVSSKAQAASAQQQQATVNAAKTCYTELKSTGAAAFKTKYGTFGRCVSQHAQS
jgi:hypothetical protein